jgi:uncharacterized phiE125 gp8 family phage protein
VSIDWTFWPSDPYWTDSGFWDWRPPWVRPRRPGTMLWALQQTAAPTSEPVDLDLAKAQVKQDSADDDVLILHYISVARDEVERLTGLSLLTQTWKLYLDRFPRFGALETWPWPGTPSGAILLPRFPVQAVSSVQWLGADGTTNTIDPTTYTLDTAGRPPRLTPTATQFWPSNALVPQAGVIVTLTAGYTTVAGIPPTLRQAMLLAIGEMYENRERTMADARIAVKELPAYQNLVRLHKPPLVG